jgi:tetratricopeptide (TPR) repeat protein
MVLGWSGISVQPDELVQEVYSPDRRGSLQPDLISAVRRHGRVAYPISGINTLTAELAAGHPVLVLLNLGFFWYPKWHYAVVVGYDNPAGEIILHSGNIQNERLSFRIFNNLWARSERWGLLVLPPSRFPAEVQEDTWLEAVVGLERAKQWPAAITAYEMTITQWPESYSGWIGLGNSRYAIGDLSGAASAFRHASHLNQENGIAFNNLAQVLWEMGQPEEALTAAHQAIILGGPLLEKFKQTLYEIEARLKKE